MEITQAQIRDFAGSIKQYEEAKQIIEQQRITSLDIDDFSYKDIIMINATLKDEKGYQEVNMSIDKEDLTVRAHVCTCTEHGIKTPSCIHCTAVLLKLQKEHEKQQALVTTQEPIPDTYAISLINAYEEQIIYSSLAMNLKQEVHLDAVLEIRPRSILALTLKVGNERRYIVKNIAKFLDDIHHNVEKSYGSELKFLHNRFSFDEESQKLLDFILHHEQDAIYFQNQAALSRCPQAKNICMTPDALDEFFDLYKGEDVLYRIKNKLLMNIRFRNENPKLQLNVKKLENAYEIALAPMDYRLFEGREHLYVWMNQSLYRCDIAFTKACAKLLTICLAKKDPLIVNDTLLPGFYNNVIMNVRSYIPLHGADISEFAPLPLECRIYLDMPNYNVISAKMIYCYGNDEYNAFSTYTMNTSRNFNDEIAKRLVFTRYMTRIDTLQGIAYIEHSQDAIYTFLTRGMEELSTICEIYASEEFKKLKIKKYMRVSMGVRIISDLLEIRFDTYDFPVEELQQLLESYRMNKKYYRMKNGSFINLEDSALQELSAILYSMHVSEKEINSGVVKVSKYRSLYIDSSLKNSEQIKVDRDSSFKDIVRGIRNVKDSDFAVPPALKSILRNYQKTGFRWMKTMATYGFSGILADDMGIGKTLQVITLLEDEKLQVGTAFSLVICPASLILNWQSEIDKFSQTLTYTLIHGNSDKRALDISQCQNYDIVITSYDYLRRDIELYEHLTFHYQILDEAQYIKNHNTKNAITVKKIHSLHRFALTGTPIENSLAELWSIFDFLMPGYLYTYRYFKKHYEIPIVEQNNPAIQKDLKHMVEPFILRRVKKDVLKELPEKVENTMLIELDEEARKLYMANAFSIRKEVTESFREKGFKNSSILIISMMTRLRQLCCDPRLLYENYSGKGTKITACMELIETCRISHKKVLLFSQFTSLLALLEKELIHRDIPYYLLKGSTPKVQRQQLVNSFNSDSTTVFLISLKAGGTGLNLTSAEVVIHFDPWWNISAQNQATDRAYRIGQHNNVQVVKLIAKDTIEEKIQHLQTLKQDLSDSILHQNDDILTHMSKEELMKLFQ